MTDEYDNEPHDDYNSYLFHKRLFDNVVWPKFLKGKKIVRCEGDKFIMRMSDEFALYFELCEYEDDGEIILKCVELESDY